MSKLFTKSILFFILFLIVSCNSNTDKKKSSYSFPITDSNYNRLTDENIAEIVKGYVKEDMRNVYAFKKIEKKGEAPFLIVAFEKNKFLHFHTVKKEANTWTTQWADSLNEEQDAYFMASEWKFEEKKADIDNDLGTTISLEGCYPHECMNKNGIFYYDTKNEKGYVSIFSDEENFKDFFPFGVPKEYNALKNLEEQVLNKLKGDSYSSLLEKIKYITGNLLAFSINRIIPSVESNNNISKVVDEILINKNSYLGLKMGDYNCYTVFLIDYNEDKYLDYLFWIEDSKNPKALKNGLYLYSGKNGNLTYLDLEIKDVNKNIEDGLFYFPPSEILSQKEQNGDYYLIVPLQPRSGMIDFPKECYLFKLNKTGFKITYDTIQCSKIISKMNLDSSLYIPN